MKNFLSDPSGMKILYAQDAVKKGDLNLHSWFTFVGNKFILVDKYT